MFKSALRELEVRLNNSVRTITCSRKLYRVTTLFKQLKLLNLHHIYQQELGNTLFFFVANKSIKITQNCTVIKSNGRLQRDP